MELGGVPSDLYAGYVIEDSDLEYSDCSEGESSEDEGCSRQQQVHHPHASSEDEFEKEMDSEIMNTLELMVSPTAMLASKGKPHQSSSSSVKSSSSKARVTKSKGNGQSTSKVSQSSEVEDKKEAEYYDEIYFDSSSDSEREEGGERRTRNVGKKVRKLTNDELFYDPLMDEEDEKWVKRQRMAYHNVKLSRELMQKKERSNNNEQKSDSESGPSDTQSSTHTSKLEQTTILPKSDAVLNCPACMTTLCLDCQRHDFYVNQYRAMFVMNCCIMKDEVLTYMPKPNRKTRKRDRKARRDDSSGSSAMTVEEAEKYNPVRCSKCNTEVAVYDKDEVFHFFNVLA